MARKNNTELQKSWEEKIQKGKKVKVDWEESFKVKLSRDYFAGKQNPGFPEEDWITINKIYSHLMAQLPTLYNVDPYFYVKVKKSFSPDPRDIAKFEAKAKIRQSYLNYLKVELKMKTKARLGIQDAHFSIGVLKTRFAADSQENPDAKRPFLSESLDEAGEQIPLTAEDGSPLLEPDHIPINERYEIARVHPDDIILDEDAGTLEEKWGFIAERVRMTREEARKDKRFKKSVVKKIEPVDREPSGRKSLLSFFQFAMPTTKETKEEDILIMWEIYDLKNKEWLMIAEGADEPLIKPGPLPKGVEKHPYSILRFTLQDDSPYPIPPISQMLDLQKEYGLARSRLQSHRKRFNRKYVLNASAFEDPDTAISKLTSGEDGTVLVARTTAEAAVSPIKDAPLDQQNLLEIQNLNNDLTEIAGSPGAARGIADADSATEAGILNKRLEVREGDRLSMVIDWILESAEKLDQLVQANITRDEAVKITGPEGEFWEMVRAEDFEDIDGEFEYSVNVGAMTPQLPDIERSQWLAFMSQVVIPMPHILTAPHFMKTMARMFHIEDEASLEELRQIGLKILSGQAPPPGGRSGGQNPNNPATATAGTALGFLGGNANGGGAN